MTQLMKPSLPELVARKKPGMNAVTQFGICQTFVRGISLKVMTSGLRYSNCRPMACACTVFVLQSVTPLPFTL